MTDEQIEARLSDELGAQFETREQGNRGALFLTHATIPGGQLRLRIEEDALDDYRSKPQMDEALNCAIGYLREDRGDVVIREDSRGVIVIIQESVARM
jgi:hypothetical protein